MNSGIFGTQDNESLKRVLDATSLRNKYITNNIANASTPGYVSTDLDFAEMVKEKSNTDFMGLSCTNEKHFGQAGLELDDSYINRFLRYKKSSEEEEMVNLASNSITNKAATELLARKYRLLTTAIMGGR